MKKIDFHIHTVPTISDSHFTFELSNLVKYVSVAKLDALAITNHDLFDVAQFRTIKNALSVPVFPGIEVNLENGHLLVISDGSNLEDFEAKCRLVSQKIIKVGDMLSVAELKSIFVDLSGYLIIPHYKKGPAITAETLKKLEGYVSAGEVDSAKKFIRTIKDAGAITPVLFSDARISDRLERIPVRQTYLDCGDLTLSAIKVCLQKGKVSLSEADGNELIQIFEDGQKLSTGLNVLLGERSSGKTFTLDRIEKAIGSESVKYIRQFDLVQKDDAIYERDFNSDVERKSSRFVEEYLSAFRAVVDDVLAVDLRANNRKVELYISTLLKSAEDADRQDAYSNTALFDEVELPISQSDVLEELIASIRQVIENVEFKSIVEKHLDTSALINLACELIELSWKKTLENNKRKLVNGLVKDIKESLKFRTSAVQLSDVDLYRTRLDERKINRFADIVRCLKDEAVISEESIQGFRVEVKRGSFEGAGEIKNASNVRTGFKDAFQKYEIPYEYLQALRAKEDLSPAELYKLFTKISYRILNKDGAEISGGERSEFRLLQEIKDAQNYDMLLIDEPESSFDNMFLKSDLNQILREISESMPVVVVTHNSTVGASAGADFLLFACKETEDGKPKYRLYSGHPTDKKLISLDGKSIGNHEITMNSLEAGQGVYDERRKGYEAIKDPK